MSMQPVKFYQTGTFTVGNRLLEGHARSVQANLRRTNSLNSGHRACQGCGEALGARYAIDAAMQAASGKVIAVNATGCLEVFSTPYPETSWQIPWMHSLFGNAPAVAAGVAAALRVKGRTNAKVIAQGGDGGTTDIGFGCLSGMFERNDDVLYICYDNEAYMNTGVQRSSATPPAARTATTMAVGSKPGNVFGTGKNLPLIAMAHHIPYVATASVANLRDLEAKIMRAMGISGSRYIHIHVPCPLGWGSEPADTLVLALGQDVDLSLLQKVPDLAIENGVVKVAANMMTSHPGIFAGGDMVPSERTVTVAAGHGRKAARNIDAWLRGQPDNQYAKHEIASYDRLNPWYYSEAPKTVQPMLDIIRRQSGFDEVQGGLDEGNALFEARRCLSCGNCFECDNCYGVCPDNAVIKLGPGLRYEFNYDYCKGCALCAEECPCGAIAMEPETI